MLAGASLAERYGWRGHPLPAAFVSLGIAALGAFYLESVIRFSGIPISWRWIGSAFVAMGVGLALMLAGHEARIRTIQALIPYARIWGLASLVYFAVLGLASNGVGHWEPNYRFWPATWSSDNELPWIFAEAVKHNWDLKNLFGGGWLPTDRPPLMTGAHLLLADVFSWLQSGNDGIYLRGQAYNAAAVALNALWVPAGWWLLVTLRPALDNRSRIAIMMLVGFLPLVLFNTIYGWPKAFGAAFALVAFGIAWQIRGHHEVEPQKSIIIFFVLGSLSMLAHGSTALFLMPLGILFLWWTAHRSLYSVLIGFGIALSLMASWAVYKVLVLPSTDPITKYALTGEFGFGHPEWTLWEIFKLRYSSLDFWQWMEIKKIMLLQSFMPLDNHIYSISMNSDFGVGVIDRLRAWDFLMLSKGNLAVPFLTGVAAWGALTNFAAGRLDQVRAHAPFLTLIGVALVSWLLMILGFFAPIIIHHWPQAALFGLALSGAVIVHDLYPATFGIALIAVMTYTGLVWILSPLHVTLSIDAGAAVILLLVCILPLVHRLLAHQANHGNVPARIAVGLDGVFEALKTNEICRRLGNAAAWSLMLRALAVGALVFAAYITFTYIHQPLADSHAFRQTQTAMTSYWMLREGWSLAYQTPVAGFPWSIPFELPIYQTIVAAICGLFGLDLDAVGRFVSFAFLIACGWPAFPISRRLGLSPCIPWVFCALLWTSPLYVYWGRTFMIETAALFFSFACLPYAIDLIQRAGGLRCTVLFVIFGSAGVLQKATTGGPVMLFLLLACIFVHVRNGAVGFPMLRRLVFPVIVFCIPLLIGLIWTHYTDIVKRENPLGIQLTSKALATWNFGTMAQKLDPKTWRLLVWERVLKPNAGGILGVLLLLLPWFIGPDHRQLARLALAAVVIFLLPLLIFTNLHIVHDYYQVSCVLFLIFALSIVIGGWLNEVTGIMAVVPAVTLVIILSNISAYHSGYGVVAARSLPELDPRSVKAYRIGRYLNEHTKPNVGLVIFGQGYSSEIAFQAQRKSMTAPVWFEKYRQVWENPRDFLDGLDLGAIVICPSEGGPSEADINERLSKENDWRLEQVDDCKILLKNVSQ